MFDKRKIEKKKQVSVFDDICFSILLNLIRIAMRITIIRDSLSLI